MILATDNFCMQEQNVLRLNSEQNLPILRVFMNHFVLLIGNLDLNLFESLHGQAHQQLHLLLVQGFKLGSQWLTASC